MATDETPIEHRSADSGWLHEEITKEIIGAAFEVHRVPGYGRPERACQQVMAVEWRLRHVKLEVRRLLF